MPIEVSRFTEVLMDQVQLVALAVMAAVYLLKIRWILNHAAASERTPARGDHGKAIRYSYATLAMPWELPSTRRHWFRYLEFAFFHIAVAVAILVTFVMPYWPHLVAGRDTVDVLQVTFAFGLLAAASRLVRRIGTSAMRAVSSPDDYFSLLMLGTWFAAAILAAPQTSEPALIAFFGLTAFFLVYVPFSKISHYIYWPFIRYYTGKHFGHRGVYPAKSVPRHA